MIDEIKNIKFECKECGACCKYMILEIWGMDIIREPKLAEHATLLCNQEDEVDAYKIHRLPAPCPLLTTDNRCSIYSSRPTMCVAFGHGESRGGDPDSERCEELRKIQNKDSEAQ